MPEMIENPTHTVHPAQATPPANSGIKRTIKHTTSNITPANRLDHILARMGVRRSEHRVEPGLYALGNPTDESPVFASANYTLSFDALRSSLRGIDGYILVLDTMGINVWCAAGKGTFGTDELVRRIESTGLSDIVSRRTLIVPQLGATGVAAHKVRARSGFRVEFGPVRACDLPEYLKTHTATEEMRRVRFTLSDRMVLIPVELFLAPVPVLAAAVVISLIGGYMAAAGAIAAILAGVVLFPILLPWIPTKDFSTRGFIIGILVALPFAWSAFQGASGGTDAAFWMQSARALPYMLIMPSVTAFLALNFTGATTFTSVTGVKREIYAHVPKMAWMFAGGIVIMVILALLRILGGV